MKGKEWLKEGRKNVMSNSQGKSRNGLKWKIVKN
jgi:hypothetical protein